LRLKRTQAWNIAHESDGTQTVENTINPNIWNLAKAQKAIAIILQQSSDSSGTSSSPVVVSDD